MPNEKRFIDSIGGELTPIGKIDNELSRKILFFVQL